MLASSVPDAYVDRTLELNSAWIDRGRHREKALSEEALDVAPIAHANHALRLALKTPPLQLSSFVYGLVC